MAKDVVKGQVYSIPDSDKGQFHYGAKFKIVSVTGQNDDDYAEMMAIDKKMPKDFPYSKTPTKDSRHFNKFRPRLWWVRGYMREVKN